VLANNPMFDKRDEMVDGYVAYATQLSEDRLQDAVVALRRAERINSNPKRQPALESLRLTLEGEQWLERGVADQSLFRKALELDPSNQRARQDIALIERGERQQQPEHSRYYGAGAIGAVALLAILLIVLWRPKAAAASPPESPSETPATAPASATSSPAEAGEISANGARPPHQDQPADDRPAPIAEALAQTDAGAQAEAQDLESATSNAAETLAQTDATPNAQQNSEGGPSSAGELLPEPADSAPTPAPTSHAPEASEQPATDVAASQAEGTKSDADGASTAGTPGEPETVGESAGPADAPMQDGSASPEAADALNSTPAGPKAS